MSTEVRTIESVKRLYGIDQAAAIWGVSRWSVVKWISAGKIATVKLGSRTLITSDEVNRVMEAGV